MINNSNPLLSDAENKVWCPVRNAYCSKRTMNNLLGVMAALWAIGKNRGFFRNLFKNGKTGILGSKKLIDKIISAPDTSTAIEQGFDAVVNFLQNKNNLKNSSLLKETDLLKNLSLGKIPTGNLISESLIDARNISKLTDPKAETIENKCKNLSLTMSNIGNLIRKNENKTLLSPTNQDKEIKDFLEKVNKNDIIKSWDAQCVNLKKYLKEQSNIMLNNLRGKTCETDYKIIS